MRLIALTLLLGTSALAADGGGSYARITVLEPREGKARDFEAGYRRHLAWHRSKRDPWAWYGWTVSTGPRTGVFIDGTFDRTADELDAPVAPAEDSADNQRNVFPHARLATTALYRLRPELSRGTSAQLKSPWATLATVHVKPGRERDFEAALARLEADRRLVYELLSGGDGATYVVFVPGEKVSELLGRPALPASDAIASAHTEAVRFRPELGYEPSDPAASAK